MNRSRILANMHHAAASREVRATGDVFRLYATASVENIAPARGRDVEVVMTRETARRLRDILTSWIDPE